MRHLARFNVLIGGLGWVLFSVPLAFAMARISTISSSQSEIDTFNFLKASIDGDAGKVKSYLRSGKNVNITRTNGVTALMAACLYSRHDVIDVLLAAGADVNQQDRHGKKALDYAASRGQVGTVEYLSINHKIPDDNNYVNYAKLMNVAYMDNQNDYFKDSKKIAYINRVGGDGTTPLNNAAMSGNLKAVKKLTDLGADINLRANHRFNPDAVGEWKKHPEYKIFGNENSLISPVTDLYGDESPAENGYTPIELAAMLNKPEVIGYLLEKGAKINGQAGRLAPLILAIQTHSVDAVKLLIRKGADTAVRDNQGVSAKLLALGGENQEIKRALESKDSTAVTKDEINNLLFKSVSSMGYWDTENDSMLKEALRLGADPNARNAEGKTVLEIAVVGVLPDAVSTLLEHKADPNVKDRQGDTLLMKVGIFQNPTEADKLEVTKRLVEKGADVNATNAYGDNVLSTLINLPTIVEYLVEHGAKIDLQDEQGRTALYRATEANEIEVVKVLLKLGANPNDERTIWATMHYGSDDVRKVMLSAPKFDKKSPMWVQMAATEGRNETLKQLIALGADLNTPGEGNQTALLMAIDKDKTDSAKMLIAAGAKTDTVSQSGYGSLNGETALCLASRKGNFEVVKPLIAAKADVNATCGSLVAATRVGHLGIVEALVAAGADLQDRYTGNWEALFVAAENDRLDIAKELIKGGVRIDVRDNMNSTPLMIAASKGSLNVIRLLVSKGANLEATNAKRPINDFGSNFIGTPLGWAIEYKQNAAATLLRELGAKR